MGQLTLIAGLCLVVASLASASHHPKLVCSFDLKAMNRQGYAKFTVADINPGLCTHVIFTSADINDYRNYKNYYWAFKKLKDSNPHLTTLLEVAGAQEFSTVTSSSKNIAAFSRTAIILLRYFGFDGINILWKYPGAQNKEKFTLLCKELKKAFVVEALQTGRDSLLLFASVSAEKATIDESYEVAKINMFLDSIIVLAFDFYRSSDVTRHHSPLSQDSGDLNAVAAMNYWRIKGASAKKLILGCAAYGRSFELTSASSSDIGAPVNGPGAAGSYTGQPGFLAYYEVCQFLDGAKVTFIEEQGVPCAIKGNQWLGYDNKRSLAYKVKFIKDNHFGGIHVSSLDLDDFTGHLCKHGRYPFTSYLKHLLGPVGTFCIGKKRGLYSNPLDATSFYNCWDGRTFLQVCPTSLVFREYCQCCESASKVHPVNPCHGKVYGVYPVQYDDRAYYSCHHGKAHIKYCKGNMVFDSSRQTCDYPPSAHTGKPCYGKPDGNIPNPHNPKTFYKCVHGTAYLLQCQEHTVFTTSCVYPTSTGKPCYGRPDGYTYANYANQYSYYKCISGKHILYYCDADEVFDHSCHCCLHPTTTPTDNFCYGKSIGFYVDPTDSHYFYHCANGNEPRQKCAANFIFNPGCNCCEYPKVTLSSPCNAVSQGYYAYHYDKHCFYKCDHGITQLIQCPKNHVYQHSCHCCVYGQTTNHENPCYGKASGYFPYKYNPQYYFSCAPGIGYLQKCAAGTVFRASCTCCDFPTSKTRGFCSGRPDGLYPHPHARHYFYHCAHGRDFLKSCPANLIFDTHCTCCNYPPKTYTAPCYGKPNGLIPYGHDQSWYYNCWYGDGYLQQCPLNLIYRHDFQYCDYPVTPAPTNPCYKKANGLYPKYNDIQSYYSCYNGIAHHHYCDGHKVFKLSCQCCDYPTVSYPVGPCHRKPDGLIPNSHNKHTFYKCVSGKAYLLKCPAHTVFIKSFCVYPRSTRYSCHTKPDGLYADYYNEKYYYLCKNGVHTRKYCGANLVYKPSCHCCVNPTNPPSGSYCFGKPNGVYPNPKNLHTFYHCSNGYTYIKKCPADLVFNPAKRLCDYYTHPTNPCHGVHDGYYPYKNHASSFYHCVGGVSYLLNCPDHYYYKESAHCCVYKP